MLNSPSSTCLILCIVTIAASPRNVTFLNSGNETVHVYRLSRIDGKEVFYGSVTSGEKLTVDSHAWESFVARDLYGVAGRMTVAHSKYNVVFELSSPELTAARVLADLINSGAPTDTASIIERQTLDLALGKLVVTSTGWNARVESFIELLRFRDPLRYEEQEAIGLSEDAWDIPMLIRRDGDGFARDLGLLSYQKLLHDKGNILVQPSYGTSLPLNVGVDPLTPSGTWSHLQLNNNVPAAVSNCETCEMPLQTFASLALDLPMHLNTSAHDRRNIVLQRQGLKPKDIFPESICPDPISPPEFNDCDKSEKMAIGLAGSGRGLLFHAHSAVANEALVGRKLWALFPPRNDASIPGTRLDCPWPPWDDRGDHINEALASFFSDAAPKSQGSLRSCRDLRMSAIQWIVYEMPKLTWDQRPLLFLHHPGEVLWVPESWQHATVQLDDSLYLYTPACGADSRSVSLRNRTSAAIQTLCARMGHFCGTEYCHIHDVRHPNCNDSRLTSMEASLSQLSGHSSAPDSPAIQPSLSQLRHKLKRMQEFAPGKKNARGTSAEYGRT